MLNAKSKSNAVRFRSIEVWCREEGRRGKGARQGEAAAALGFENQPFKEENESYSYHISFIIYHKYHIIGTLGTLGTLETVV